MYILDYRVPERPVHHLLTGITITASGAVANLTSTYFGAMPGAHISQTFSLDGVDISSDPVLAAATWLGSPVGPIPGGIVVQEADYLFASRRLDMAVAVRAKRNAVRDGGVTTPFGRFDTDIDSRLNISGAVVMAGAIGGTFSVSWRLSDNTTIQLNATQMVQAGVLVGQFVSACQSRKNELDAALNAAQNLNDLDAIDIDTGWPV